MSNINQFYIFQIYYMANNFYTYVVTCHLSDLDIFQLLSSLIMEGKCYFLDNITNNKCILKTRDLSWLVIL